MTTNDDRSYSPGLAGVLAGETALSLVDGANGRLLYRGYPIGELVRKGSFAQVAHLLWADEWLPDTHLPCAPLDDRILAGLRHLPAHAHPMDALRTAFSAWGAWHLARYTNCIDCGDGFGCGAVDLAFTGASALVT